jgi:uncharacterized DUF497 family protein
LTITASLPYIQLVNIEFEWDPNKEQYNIRKHGISFHEAASAFADLLSWTFPDPDHSVGENRCLTIGTSARGRLLIIAHTDRREKTRIINAREVTPREREFYEEGK